VLRHSFASNLARTGRVCQAEIDDLMGHQTEEMRLRYRHLFPEDKRRAVDVLDYAQSPT
jgi:integrase